MNDSDFEEFKKAFLTICELWDKPASPIIQALYFKALQGFTLEQVHGCISKAIVSCKFFPKPVELIEFITGGGTQQIEDASQLEGLKVIDAVKKYGAYNTVAFSDPHTTAVIQEGFGGWIKLCSELRVDGEKWFLKDFARLYQAFKRQGRGSTDNLIGLVQAHNQDRFPHFLEKGIKLIPDPVFVDGGKKLIDGG